MASRLPRPVLATSFVREGLARRLGRLTPRGLGPTSPLIVSASQSSDPASHHLTHASSLSHDRLQLRHDQARHRRLRPRRYLYQQDVAGLPLSRRLAQLRHLLLPVHPRRRLEPDVDDEVGHRR